MVNSDTLLARLMSMVLLAKNACGAFVAYVLSVEWDIWENACLKLEISW